MKKPTRLLIYLGLIGCTGFLLAPALSINPTKIGGPVRDLIGQMNGYALAAVVGPLALGITYLITSGWGLVILGMLSLCGLIVVSILHPYLFPLLIPLFAVWVFCATARRTPKAKA